MRHAILEYRAAQIEAILAGARVTGGVVTPRSLRFQVMPTVAAGLTEVARAKSILKARLGRRVRVHAQRAGEGLVEVELPRDEGERVTLLDLVSDLDPGEIPPADGRTGRRYVGRDASAASGEQRAGGGPTRQWQAERSAGNPLPRIVVAIDCVLASNSEHSGQS